MNFFKTCIILFGFLTLTNADLLAQFAIQNQNQPPISIVNLQAALISTVDVEIRVGVTSSIPLDLHVRVYDYEGGELIDSQTINGLTGDFIFPVLLSDAGTSIDNTVVNPPNAEPSSPSYWVECGIMMNGVYFSDSGCTVDIDGG